MKVVTTVQLLHKSNKAVLLARRAITQSASKDGSTMRPADTYEEAYRQSIEDPEGFWEDKANQLDWTKKWTKALDTSRSPFQKWFVGGELNVCHNALDRHVSAGLHDTTALIYDSPITGTKNFYTYSKLLHMVQQCAGSLHAHGIGKGDTVVIYMPMIPQTLVSMLACARIGATHCVVFGGFAADELAVRIKHVKPKAIIAASVGLEPGKIIPYKPILDEAIAKSGHDPKMVLLYHRHSVESHENPMVKGRDFDWDHEIRRHPPFKSIVPVESSHPLYILHTSGTTGAPKGIVRDSGGYATVLPWSMSTIFGMRPGETWWAASDFGWVVGHSYMCYAPLLAGLTTVLYEGKPVGTPNSGAFFRIAAEHKCTNFFAAPTALRAIRQADPDALHGKKFHMKHLRAVHAAGEKLDIETRHWAEREFRVPVLDHWWQTESGWPIAAQCIGYRDANWQPPKDCSGRPVPGWNLQTVANQNDPSDGVDHSRDEVLGRIVCKLPMPPGFAMNLWENDDEKFIEKYFKEYPGYYDTADAGNISNQGQVQIMARVDDVINVAGHRLSTGALEEAILGHPKVVDCAVVGLDDKIKGTMPLAFCVVTDDATGNSADYAQQVKKIVREKVGAVASIKAVIFCPKLPKTRSGKISRQTLGAMANKQPYKAWQLAR